MKTPTYKKSLFAIMAVLFVISSGWYAYSAQDGVIQIYKNANTPVDDDKKVDTVRSHPKNVVQVNTRYQGGRFWTETRKDKIERFKCSKCHNNKSVRVIKAAEVAHADIVLDHGGQVKPLDCYTCHDKGERDYLVTEAGSKVDMDHSYQMCGQCHFRQKKDWVGGAHGKRVSYWVGKRVVRNCTFCHDPHSPHFDKQWPKTYSPPYSNK